MDNILYLGIKGSVVAIDRGNGAELWRCKLKGSSFVNILVTERDIYAHTGGHLYCVDRESGQEVWHNELKGLGFGMAMLALEGISTDAAAVIHEIQAQQQRNSAAAGGAGAGGAV
ncbi:MAG: PQQ-binding-like beta-propeller repeat protein [Phycisphaerae bacterium]|nr:PQQ-binding-like beta-propeller repeat protein [Phycisphaerae bacterium]